MIKQNLKLINRFLVLLDILIIFLALVLSWYIRFKNGIFEPVGGLSLEAHIIPMLYAMPLFIAVYSFFSMYQPFDIKGAFNEYTLLIRANAVAILIYVSFLYMFKNIEYSRKFLLIFFCVVTCLLFIERRTMRYLLKRRREKGLSHRNILIVGYSNLAEALIWRVKNNKYWGYNVVGVIDDNITEMFGLEEVKVVGKISELEKVILEKSVEEVFITISVQEYSKLGEIITACEKTGVKTQIIPDYYRFIPAKPYVEELEGLPVINIRYIPLENVGNKLIKRLFDVVFSLFVLTIFSPILLFVVVGIKLTSRGPVVFKQERMGYNRKTFVIYKFRSMIVQKESECSTKWTTKDDCRKTKFGAFLRKTSLDEFPQFFNVLKGDMSVIGPRPERPHFVEVFKEEIPKYMVKHLVRPGLTGWAQVNGYRGDTSIDERIKHDLYYIENWSFFLDLKIVLLTLVNGFFNRNAY